MKISVITASYNYAQYIEKAINSVINQTYQNWELIIVDDGSSDNSVEIIKSFCEKDSRIKFFQHENSTNKGLKETILLGLENTSGEWIAFLESDDYFEPENLSEKVKITEKFPDVSLIFNKVKILSDKKTSRQILFEKIQEKLSKMTFPKNMFKDFAVDNMILTFSCVMVKADILKNLNFDSPYDSALDRRLWIQTAYKHDFYYLPEKLTFWQLHPESYILKKKKPALYFPQISAYYNIFKENKSFKLLFFILSASIRSFFVKIYKKIILEKGKSKCFCERSEAI